MKRREFLKAAVGGALSVPFLPNLLTSPTRAAEPAARWFKGNIHSHSQWSDGKDLPEVVVDAYKQRGYEFFCLSDHNVIQQERLRFDGFAMNFTPKDLKPFEGETSFWKRMSAQEGWPNLIDKHLQYARDRFGADSITIKETAEGTYVRMKTFEELKKQFAEKDKFLLIPGFEMTAQYAHFNLVNVEESFFLEDPSVSALVSKSFDKAVELYGDLGRPWLFTVNHPLWQYYNIQPSDLIARPEIRFFELNNNSTSYPIIAEAWTPESFWDIVNAYRVSHDQELLYATGTDDSHGIFRKDVLPFIGWMYVKSTELSAKALFEAMGRGDSYTSSGIELDEISFDGKTLAVKAKVQEEGQYKVEFFGVKKDYDPSFKTIEVNAGPKIGRKVESYSGDVSRVLATVDGSEGSYTLQPDDLFVRAKVSRVGAGEVNVGPDYPPAPLSAKSAWTQPYRA